MIWDRLFKPSEVEEYKVPEDSFGNFIMEKIKRENILKLINAVENDDLELVTELIKDYGVEVNAKDESGKTPLMHFFNRNWLKLPKGYFEIIKVFIANGLDVNVKYGPRNCETLLDIIYHQLNLSNENNDQRAYFEVAKLLIENGLDINDIDDTYSLYTRDILSSGENDFGLTSLHRLCVRLRDCHNKQNGQAYFEIAKLLIENGADANVIKACYDFNSTPLLTLVYGNYSDDIVYFVFKIAKLLIENGADVDVRGMFDETALWHICLDAVRCSQQSRQAYFEIAKLLIENGADVNAKDESGETPLIRLVAARHPNDKDNAVFDMAKLLIENGADVNVRNKYDRTPLGCICANIVLWKQQNCLNIVKLLIENGAYCDEETSLYYATRHKNTELIELLTQDKHKQLVSRQND